MGNLGFSPYVPHCVHINISSCTTRKSHKKLSFKQTYFHTTHPYIETDGTYEAVPTRWPPAASLAAQSLQKPPCCGRLNIGVMEIACGMWDEGQGTGPSAAVWSSLLARRRRLGKRGPEWLEEGGCWLAGGSRGLPFQSECDSAMGCGFHPHSNADRDACLWNAALEQAHCAVRNNLYFLTYLPVFFWMYLYACCCVAFWPVWMRQMGYFVVLSRMRCSRGAGKGHETLNNTAATMDTGIINRNIMCKTHPSCGGQRLEYTGWNWVQREMEGLKWVVGCKLFLERICLGFLLVFLSFFSGEFGVLS